jgi:hypothetical protein
MCRIAVAPLPPGTRSTYRPPAPRVIHPVDSPCCDAEIRAHAPPVRGAQTRPSTAVRSRSLLDGDASVLPAADRLVKASVYGEVGPAGPPLLASLTSP